MHLGRRISILALQGWSAAADLAFMIKNFKKPLQTIWRYASKVLKTCAHFCPHGAILLSERRKEPVTCAIM